MSWDITIHGMSIVKSETNETFHITQLLYNTTYLMISALTVDLFPKNIIFAGSLIEHGGQGTSINTLYYRPPSPASRSLACGKCIFPLSIEGHHTCPV